MKKILIINQFGIGDVLFTTPMIRNIKASLPDSFVGYVCNKRARAVLDNNPGIDKLHIYEKDDFRRMAAESRLKAFWEFLRFIGEIKQERYDIVFDLSLNAHASFLSWVLGIRSRSGFNYKNRSPFLTRRINIDGYEGKHVVEHYLDLLEMNGIGREHKRMEVFLKSEDRQWVADLLGKNNINSDDLLIGLAPGGGASWGADARYRRWPAARHAKLADKVIEKFGAKVILLGDSSEAEIGRKLTAAMRQTALNLIGRTTLGQYLALLNRCGLVIVNDGGPLHMAVAAGAATVSLIGVVDEKVYGPYPMQGHQVVTKALDCRPCYRRFRRADCEHINCINSIQVEEVFLKVAEALNQMKG